MLRHYTLLFCILIVSGFELIAQQYPQYSQFSFNRYAINPAFGGLETSLSVTTGLRSQWGQFPGAPKTQFINAHLPLYFLNGSVGMGIENEQLGPFARTMIQGSYNYVYESSIGLISLGGRLGAQQVRISGDQLITPDGIYVDNAINHNDPILLSGDMTGIAPVWGVGLYVRSDWGEGGITFDNVPSNTFRAGDAQYQASQLMSLFLTSEFYLADYASVSPVLYVKSDFVQTQVDIGALARYDNAYGGASLRGYNSNSIDAIVLMGGIKMNEHFRISYSYDFGLSSIRSLHDGTHEFVVNYNLNKPIRTGELPPIIYNPRYN